MSNRYSPHNFPLLGIGRETLADPRPKKLEPTRASGTRKFVFVISREAFEHLESNAQALLNARAS
jgi:hypothetical protein